MSSINLSWLPDKLRAALGDGSDYGVRITYTDEGPVPLETGGGIFNAIQLLGPGPFLVVNGDTFTDIDFARCRRERRPTSVRARWPGSCSCRIQLNILAGDFGLEGEQVVDRETGRFTYSGVGVYRPEFFEGCCGGKFPMLPLLKRAIAAGRLRGELHQGEWCDVGTPERLAELDERVGGAARR